MSLRLAPLEPQHWEAVRRIFQDGIDAGMATFEAEPPDWAGWNAAHRADSRLVALAGDTVVGWAALSPVSARTAYVGVAEVSVYVARARQGQGVGRMLLEALVGAAEAAGIWTLQAVVFPQNAASLGLHRQAGFREVGRRERIARLRGAWQDTVLLERRSPTIT